MKANYYSCFNYEECDALILFGINSGKSAYNKSIDKMFSAGDGYKRLWNNVVDKNIVLDLAKELLKEYDKKITKAYISKQSLRISDVKDIMGENVFKYIENYNGWVIFVNPNCLSNWAHRCEYYFVASKDNILSEKNQCWLPDSYVDIESIDIWGKGND